jgi:hypothetical protein
MRRDDGMRPRTVWLAPAVAGLCLLLGGCTTWVKPGADDAMREAAETHCKAVSYSALPPNIVTSTSLSGPTYGLKSKCEKNSDGAPCRKVDGKYTPEQKTHTDVNADGRDTIFSDCMRRNGWIEQQN